MLESPLFWFLVVFIAFVVIIVWGAILGRLGSAESGGDSSRVKFNTKNTMVITIQDGVITVKGNVATKDVEPHQ